MFYDLKYNLRGDLMMKAYSEMSKEEMKQELASLKEQYKKYQ